MKYSWKKILFISRAPSNEWNRYDFSLKLVHSRDELNHKIFSRWEVIPNHPSELFSPFFKLISSKKNISKNHPRSSNRMHQNRREEEKDTTLALQVQHVHLLLGFITRKPIPKSLMAKKNHHISHSILYFFIHDHYWISIWSICASKMENIIIWSLYSSSLNVPKEIQIFIQNQGWKFLLEIL